MADGESGRVPPNDLDAEASVLSACMLEAGKLDEIRQVIGAQDFYADANRMIFQAIVELDADGKRPDIVLVAGLLRVRGKLAQAGGTPYLAQLSDATPATARILEHAQVIAAKAKQRAVIASCQRFAAEGYGDVGEVTAWAQDAAQALAEVAAKGEEEDPAELMAELMPREMAAMRDRASRRIELSGVDTGLTLLNKLTGGLAYGKLHVVGGRPGMGKTSFALQLAVNVARQNLGVVFVSAEMLKDELARKAIALDARVDHAKVKSGVMLHEDWARVAESAVSLARLPLSLKYRSAATISLIRSTVRKEARRLADRGAAKLGLVVVDYLQILNGKDLIGRGENREREVSELSKRLMWLGGEFGCPVLALSQLNRSVESRSNKSKRPSMSDLRESGGIEQDAYTITLLYRDEYYNKASPDRGLLEAILAKNRGGPEGRAFLKFTAELGRVDNLASDYQYGGADEEEQDGDA